MSERAFAGCVNLKVITIPESVTYIGDNAFLDCVSLEEVNFNALNCKMGSGAFEIYSKKSDVEYDGTNMEEYLNSLYPLGTLNIGEGVWLEKCNFNNTNFTEINIATSYVPYHAFVACVLLEKLTIGKDVTYIGDSAFLHCVSLKEVNFKGTEEQWNNIEMGSGNDCLLNAPNKKFATDVGTIVAPGETGTVIVTIYAPNNGPVSHLIVNMPVGTELNAAYVETYLYNEFGLDVLADNCDATIAKDKIYYATVYNTEETTKTATFEVTVWDSEGSRIVEISVIDGSTVNANIIEEILSANFETEAIADDFGTIIAVSGEKYTVTAYE